MFTGATSWPRRSSGCASRWRCSSRRDPSAAWRTLSAAVAVRFSTGHHRRRRGPSGRQYRRASAARICVKRSRRSGLFPRQTHTVAADSPRPPPISRLSEASCREVRAPIVESACGLKYREYHPGGTCDLFKRACTGGPRGERRGDCGVSGKLRFARTPVDGSR